LNNKIAASIMLLAGSIAAIVCLIKGASLDTMLLAVFFAMLIFMIIGFAVQTAIERLNKAAEIRMKEEAEKKREEEARVLAAREEEERRLQQEEIQRTYAKENAEQAVINDVLAAGISAKYNASNK